MGLEMPGNLRATASTSPTQQPAASPQPSQPSGLMGKATDAIGRRNEELKKAANYARGGIMPVVGAGTGTSDSVPVVVAGQDVRLSNGEGAAILPARTMRNPAAVQAVEGIIEATNGKPPVRGREGWPTAGFSANRTRQGSAESGVPGTASRRRTPGHHSGLLPLQQRFLRRLNPFPRSQFSPKLRRRTSSGTGTASLRRLLHHLRRR